MVTFRTALLARKNCDRKRNSVNLNFKGKLVTQNYISQIVRKLSEISTFLFFDITMASKSNESIAKKVLSCSDFLEWSADELKYYLAMRGLSREGFEIGPSSKSFGGLQAKASGKARY